MKSPLIVTLSIVGVLVTGTAAIAVNSSAFSSVEQNRLGDQSALLAPAPSSMAPTLPASSSEPGETAVPEADADVPSAIGTPGYEQGTGPVSGTSAESVSPTSAPAVAAESPVATEPAPPTEMIVPAPRPAPATTPSHESEDGSLETEHDD